MEIETNAMVLHKQQEELKYETLLLPELKQGELLIKVGACAVCRTDLHVIDGDLKNPLLPLVLGHEIVGQVAKCGAYLSDFQVGDRVAVPWLGSSCQTCRFCTSKRENLCDNPTFTGYTKHGGYAEYTIANSEFTFKISKHYDSYTDAEIAPMLCAGLIGWRSFKFASRANLESQNRTLGIYGFGAAGHLVLQIARHFAWRVFVFTRAGDYSSQQFALKLGASWAGDSSKPAPEALDAAIVFAPLGELVPSALASLDKGGIVVCGGIHMTKIPEFPYEILWQERELCSVANLTRQDGLEFFEMAWQIPIKAQLKLYKLKQANRALADLRNGNLDGAAVLCMGG